MFATLIQIQEFIINSKWQTTLLPEKKISTNLLSLLIN